MLKKEDKFPRGHFDTHYVLKKNDMGRVPLFWVWVDWVHEAAQLIFPTCYTELTVTSITETEDEMIKRLTSDIPHMPLLDEWDDCFDATDYVAVMALPLCQRHRAEALSIKAKHVTNRASNAAIALKNADNSRELADGYEHEFAKVDARPRLAAWLVSSEVIAIYNPCRAESGSLLHCWSGQICARACHYGNRLPGSWGSV